MPQLTVDTREFAEESEKNGLSWWELGPEPKGACMSVEATTRIMKGYFEALMNKGDFSEFFTEDVVWTTMETGEEVKGRTEVRDYIVALHTVMFDAHPELHAFGSADGYAFVEGVFVGTHIGELAGIAPTGAEVRVPYCVAYDVADEGIRALRGYLSLQMLITQVQAGSAVHA